MDLRVVAIAFVALVGVWCLVVLPAMWLSGTMSQEEDARSVPPGGFAQTGQSDGRGNEEVTDGR